jgi:Domain of unknown function (DUF4386)
MSATVEQPTEWSPRALARAIALLFLLTIVLGIAAQAFVSDRLISFKDPARTASNILANEALYRTGFTLYMIEMAAQIATTVLLFHLLKPVDRRIATLALAFGLVGCTVKTFSRVFYLAPLFLLKHSAFGAFPADQLEAVTLILLNVNDRGAGVALALFGFESVLEGWLILRSTFLPRWLGALTIISGAGWLAFLSPTLGYAVFNVVALVALIGSIATIGWLIVKGVDEERWRALALSSMRPSRSY